jgi:chaperonin GroES
MKLKPLHDWAVIHPAGAAEVTAGGLIIPDTAKEKPQEGVVEAIGPGAYEEEKGHRKKEEKKERRFVPTTVKPGDRVMYERYAGQTYTIDGEDRVLVRERDILGILERPLQIPAVTSSSATTALVRQGAGVRDQGAKKEKTAKKAGPKKGASRKGQGAGVKKAASKKAAVKKAPGGKGPAAKAKKTAVKKAKKKK